MGVPMRGCAFPFARKCARSTSASRRELRSPKRRGSSVELFRATARRRQSAGGGEKHLRLALGRIEPDDIEVREVRLKAPPALAQLKHERARRREMAARLGDDAAHDLEPVLAADMREPRLRGIFRRK